MEAETALDPDMITLAAETVADLWVEQIQKPINKDNGDNNPMLFMIATMNTRNARSELTPQKIDWFRGSIIRQVEKSLKERPTWGVDISADYGPDAILSTACHDAGINVQCIPWKSFTQVDVRHNRISYKFGYSAQHQSKAIL